MTTGRINQVAIRKRTTRSVGSPRGLSSLESLRFPPFSAPITPEPHARCNPNPLGTFPCHVFHHSHSVSSSRYRKISKKPLPTGKRDVRNLLDTFTELTFGLRLAIARGHTNTTKRQTFLASPFGGKSVLPANQNGTSATVPDQNTNTHLHLPLSSIPFEESQFLAHRPIDSHDTSSPQ